MPNIPHAVHQLNQDVFNVLKTVKDPKQMTVDEAKVLKEAILKDGKVDDNEQDLLNELIVKEDSAFLSLTGDKIIGTTAETAKVIDINAQGSATADGEKIKVSQLTQEAADALNITFTDKLARSAELSYEFLDDMVIEPINTHVVQPVVDAAKRLISHVWQYDPSQGTRKENSANCGTACAKIVGQNFGIDMPKLNEMRSMVGARRGSGKGAFALSTNQVIRAVEKQAASQGVEIEGKEERLTTNVDDALDKMRASLEKGEQVILLTSNIAMKTSRSLNSNGGKGHYVVVNEVREDGSIVITDPQKPEARGKEIVHSREHLETHLKRRTRFGRPNVLLTFARTNPEA